MKVGDLVKLSDGVTTGIIVRITKSGYDILFNGHMLFVTSPQIKRVISKIGSA